MEVHGLARVILYTTTYCAYCSAAKAFLRARNIEFEEIDVTDDPSARAEMERKSAHRTVPQIFIDGISIGGFDDLRRLAITGELNQLLGRSS